MTLFRNARRFEGLLQDQCDRLFRTVPDKIRVAVEAGPRGTRTMPFTYESWTPALVRARVDNHLDLDIAAGGMGVAHALGEEDLALALAEHLFGHLVAMQRSRNAAARRFGLERDGGWIDLPFERMLVDPTIYRLLDGTRTAILLMAHAARAKPTNRWWLSAFEVAGHSEGMQVIDITQKGLGLPAITSSCMIGPAKYDGSTLELPDIIPEAVACLAVGRPVGNLIATGHDDIDRRPILSVEATEEWEPDLAHERGMRTRIRFKQHLTPIGSLIVRRPRGSGKWRRHG